jgi:hypothetical protein
MNHGSLPSSDAGNDRELKGVNGGGIPVTRAEFIARQMETQITPTEKMATSYFKNGLRTRSIRKVGANQYVETAVTAVAECKCGDGDPTELYE